MKQDLALLRADVDSIDEQLVRLLNERASAVRKVNKLRAQNGAEVYDPARERIVIEHVNTLNKGPLSKGAIEEVYRDIMAVCRELQS